MELKNDVGDDVVRFKMKWLIEYVISVLRPGLSVTCYMPGLLHINTLLLGCFLLLSLSLPKSLSEFCLSKG